MINKKVIELFKNFSYSFVSNLVALFSSIIVVLIAPKILDVEQYGYMQLYVFYTSYVALLHFGWNDGVYLRYGGAKYKNLNKRLFNSQFWMLVIFEIILFLILSTLARFFVSDIDKLYVLRMTLICSLIVIPRGFLLFVLQGTNKIKEYATITMIGKITYVILFLTISLIKFSSYKIIIMIDLIGKFISLLYAIFACKDIVIIQINKFYFSFKEAIQNISVGIKVSIAYITSSLIVGLVRFGIENHWDVSTFGKVSLTISMTNLLMIFVNAVGVILFPTLRRTNVDKLPEIYKVMRDLITVPFLGIVLIYYPMNFILSNWLPQYAESLKYMGILFPIALYESKMSLLINTYLKTLRQEKTLLKINLLTLILSLCMTSVTVFAASNLDLAVLSILILLSFRYVMSEIILSKLLTLSFKKSLIFEAILTIVFVISTQLLEKHIGIVIYLFIYIVYLFFKKQDIMFVHQKLKLLLNYRKR